MSSVTALINDSLRRMVPLVSTLFLLALSFAPLPMTRALNLPLTLPPLALMGVFYWAVYRPDRFGIVAAFAIGMLADLLMGGPVGVTAFLYAAVHRACSRHQRLFKGALFRMIWAGYIACQVGVSALQWAAWSWLAHAAYPLAPFGLQLVLAVCLFPPVYWGLSRLHTAFLHHQS